MKAQRLKPWPDVGNEIPGRLRRKESAEVILACRAAAVFIGKNGIGQRRQEISALLTQQTERQIPLIPVLLPGAPTDIEPDLSLYLDEFTPVTLPEDGVEKILQGITAKRSRRKPGAAPPAAPETPAPMMLPEPVSPERRDLLELLKKVVGRLPQEILARSTPETRRIELELEELPGRVAPPSPVPWESAVHSGDKVLSLFKQRESSLLILGEPGAGKTFTLQLLARSLAEVARNDPQAPIPVILDLGSWAKQKKPLAEWLVWAIWDSFRVMKSTARSWLQGHCILPLLDGLHEVQPECRADCVEEINAYLRDHGFYGMAVCCQSRIYAELPRLKLMAAVGVRPLTEEQIERYAATTGPAGESLRAVLAGDEELRRLARQPEFLLTLTEVCYDDSSAQVLAESAGAPPEGRRRRVFEIYADQRLKVSHPDLKERTLRSLAWLARRMKENNSSLFQLGQLQPTWLPASGDRWAYFVLSRGFAGVMLLLPMTLHPRSSWMLLLYGWIAGAAVGLVDAWIKRRQGLLQRLLRAISYAVLTWFPLSWGFEQADLPGALYGAICAVMFGLVFGLRHAERGIGRDIEVAEELTWYRGSLEGALLGAAAGVIFSVILWLALVSDKQGAGLSALLVAGVLAPTGAVVGAILGGVRGRPITEQSRPDEELRSAFKSVALLFVLISFSLFLFLEGAVFGFHRMWHETRSSLPLWLPWFLALQVGLAIGLRYSGLDLLQHFVLRAILIRRGCTPARYVHFLDHTTVRGLLKKEGGGYRFYEQPLLEHFASYPSRSAGSVTKRTT